MGASGSRPRHRGSNVAPNSQNPATALPRSLLQLRPGRLPLAVCHLLPGDPAGSVFDGFSSVFSEAASLAEAEKKEEETVKTESEDRVRTVFFFHGVGGSCDVFFFQIGYLHQLGYEVVAMDLLGHGRSPVSTIGSDYAFDSLWSDALSLFDRLAAPGKRNAVVAHSYGTAFAARLCVERSKRISRAVLVAGGGPSALGGAPACLHLGVCCCCCCCCCIEAFARRIVRSLAFSPNSQPPLGRRSSPALLEAPPRVLAWTLIGQDWPEGGVDYHRQVAAPALLVHGCQDRLVSLEDEEWMLETLPLARLVRVANAGHLLPLEAPAVLNAQLRQFLRCRSPVGHGPVPPLPPPAVGDNPQRRQDQRQRRRERRGSQAVAALSYAVPAAETSAATTAAAANDRQRGVDNPALEL